MSTLSKGSRGDNVKELQQLLIDNGYLDKQYNTGYFGDLTQSALSKFQKDRKLPVNGVYDTTTTNALKSVAGSTALDSHPNLIGTPLGSYLSELKTSNPGLYYTLANATQNGIMITPGMVKAAQDNATANLTPYYEQDATNSKGALQNYLDTTLSGYENAAGQLQQAGTASFNDLNDKEGQNGTWASSARASRMKALESTLDSKFQDLYNTNRGNIAEKLQSQEYNYGAGQTPNISLNKYTPSFGQTPSYGSTSSSVYNPFNFVGRKNAEKSSNIEAFTKQNLADQFFPLSVKTNN